MADEDCTTCPELHTRLGATAGGIRALAVLIESEMVEPTVSWRDLLPLLATRAHNLADQAQGRY